MKCKNQTKSLTRSDLTVYIDNWYSTSYLIVPIDIISYISINPILLIVFNVNLIKISNLFNPITRFELH